MFDWAPVMLDLAPDMVDWVRQSEAEEKQLQGLVALQALANSRDKVYVPLQRAFQVGPSTALDPLPSYIGKLRRIQINRFGKFLNR